MRYTYHLKLAIADVSDHALDSGVFLKAGSLNSNNIVTHTVSTYGHNNFLVDHCIRGCKPGKIIFKRPRADTTPETIHYSIGGTAQNGVDYQQIPNSITIPANQDTAILNIYALLTPAATGPKTVKIFVQSPYQCSLNAFDDSTMLTIFDSLFVRIPDAPQTICPNNEVTITGIIDTTLDYQWTPANQIPDSRPLGLTIHPKPSKTTTYSLTVTMPGAPSTCQPVSRNYQIIVEPKAKISPIDTTLCLPYDSLSLNLQVSPDSVDYVYTWLPAAYLRDNYSKNNLFYAGVGDYHFTIIATSPKKHCVDTGRVDIQIKPKMTFDWIIPKDTSIPYGSQIQLNAHSQAVSWHWEPSTGLNDPNIRNPIASPKKNIIYTLTATNKYGCKATAQVKIDVFYNANYFLPNAFSPNGDGLNDYFRVENLLATKVVVFHVFNRYGQLVYGSQNPRKGWDGYFDGNICDVGVYFYYIKLKSPLGKIIELKGDVTLVR